MPHTINSYDEFEALLWNQDNKDRKIVIFYYYKGEDDSQAIQEALTKMTYEAGIALYLFECQSLMEPGACFANFKAYPVVQFIHGVDAIAHSEGPHLDQIQAFVNRLRDL